MPNSSLAFDPVFQAIQEVVAGKKPLVFAGFSGQGYMHPDVLAQEFRKYLREEIIRAGGPDKVIFIAGATEAGVGTLYKIAKEEFKIATAGIVSSLALPKREVTATNEPFQLWRNGSGIANITPQEMEAAGISPFCDATIFVNSGNSWALKGRHGSYTVLAARAGGVLGSLTAFGGGKVAYDEVEEAVRLGIPVNFFPNFLPNTHNLNGLPMQGFLSLHDPHAVNNGLENYRYSNFIDSTGLVQMPNLPKQIVR